MKLGKDVGKYSYRKGSDAWIDKVIIYDNLFSCYGQCIL